MSQTLNVNTDASTRDLVAGSVLGAIQVTYGAADEAYSWAACATVGLNRFCDPFLRIKDTVNGVPAYREAVAADFNAVAGTGVLATSITVSDDDYARALSASTTYSASV